MRTGIEQYQDKMVSYAYPNLPRNAILRLPYPWSGGSQGQETHLAPFLIKIQLIIRVKVVFNGSCYC